jgi:ABC-2 type transport system permease protein
MSELGKWIATFRVSWTQYLAYKLNFLLLVVGPVLVFFFIRYNLWKSIYTLEGITTLQGYDFATMLTYQVWVMIIGFLGQGYNGRNLAEDIRLGRISSYLIYPFSFWRFHAGNFLAFQGIQMGVSVVTLAAVVAQGWVPLQSIEQGLAILTGFFYTLCVGFFWFQMSYIIGIMAFWLDETWVIRVMMITVSQFFSGALLPLEIFPEVLQRVLSYLPFPYLTHVPVKLFMGEYDGSLLTAYLMLGFWTAVLLLSGHLLWQKGIRNYTAAGI